MEVFTVQFLQLLPEDVRREATALPATAIIDYLAATRAKAEKDRDAVTRGQQGEAWVETILRTIPECRVERVASTKWSGDFVMRRTVGAREITLMIDVKNYTNPVPVAEIAKFHRDMEIRKHDAGLLLSLGTRFVGQTDNNDLEFSTMSAAGRDAHVAMLNSTHQQVIIHTVRYLFSLVAARHHVTVGDQVAASLQEVRTRLNQMGRMRMDIQQLGQAVQTGLGRLNQDLLDLDIRTSALLDTIFRDIESQPRELATATTIEEKMGVAIRAATLSLIREFTEQPISYSQDNKRIMIGEGPLITVTRMAKMDRVTVRSLASDLATSMPTGDFTMRDDQLTFDLEGETNIQAAVDLMQKLIDREEQSK